MCFSLQLVIFGSIISLRLAFLFSSYFLQCRYYFLQFRLDFLSSPFRFLESIFIFSSLCFLSRLASLFAAGFFWYVFCRSASAFFSSLHFFSLEACRHAASLIWYFAYALAMSASSRCLLCCFIAIILFLIAGSSVFSSSFILYASRLLQRFFHSSFDELFVIV